MTTRKHLLRISVFAEHLYYDHDPPAVEDTSSGVGLGSFFFTTKRLWRQQNNDSSYLTCLIICLPCCLHFLWESLVRRRSSQAHCASGCTNYISFPSSSALVLSVISPIELAVAMLTLHEKDLLKFWMVSLRLLSRSLESAPSLSICCMSSLWLLFISAKKSFSHWLILLTAMPSR